MTLPTSAAERKTYPIATGCFQYFPDALAEISHLSYVANEQHNPGEPVHWAKEKSSDEPDAMLRHVMAALKDPEATDVDGILEVVKVAWRACAWAQRVIEGIEAREQDDDEDEPVSGYAIEQELVDRFLDTPAAKDWVVEQAVRQLLEDDGWTPSLLGRTEDGKFMPVHDIPHLAGKTISWTKFDPFTPVTFPEKDWDVADLTIDGKPYRLRSNDEPLPHGRGDPDDVNPWYVEQPTIAEPNLYGFPEGSFERDALELAGVADTYHPWDWTDIEFPNEVCPHGNPYEPTLPNGVPADQHICGSFVIDDPAVSRCLDCGKTRVLPGHVMPVKAGKTPDKIHDPKHPCRDVRCMNCYAPPILDHHVHAPDCKCWRCGMEEVC
jgi:hypothetical protein